MKEDLLKIINHYGLENQREYLGKEYQELQDELYRYVVLEDEANLITEIADVFVLCLQFMYEYGYSNEELIEEMKFKINRQLKRIESENDEILDEEEFEEIRTIEYFADISDKELLDLHSEELVKIKNKINQLLKNQKKIIERINKEEIWKKKIIIGLILGGILLGITGCDLMKQSEFKYKNCIKNTLEIVII